MDAKDFIEIYCSIITTVFAVAVAKDSINKEFVAIVIIILITIIYTTLLVYFYKDNKKNHSYGRKSDSDEK